MKTQILDIYEKFHCLAADCPTSCCKGWVLPLDEATFCKYQKLSGRMGRHIRFHIRKKEPRKIYRQFGRCPFFNSDRLCQFQANGTPELMPLVCRTYPREGIRFDKEARVTMGLSCPAVASLFVEHPGRRRYLDTDRKMEIFWDIDNVDDAFFAFLKKDEEKVLDFLWQGDRGLDELWPCIYAYLYRQHDLIIRDRLPETEGICLSFDEKEHKEYALRRKPTYSFLKIKTIDRMVLDHINYGALSVREPKFYHLIRRYLDIFGQQYLDRVDDYFDEQMHRLMADCPEAEERYRSYFSWTFQEIFFLAFENYNIIRQFLFAVLYTQLYMIFDLVDYMEQGPHRGKQRMAEVIYICEQGIRHNPVMNDNLMNVIREEFL